MSNHAETSKTFSNYYAKHECFGSLCEFIALSEPDSFDEFCDHLSIIQGDGLKIALVDGFYMFSDEVKDYFNKSDILFL